MFRWNISLSANLLFLKSVERTSQKYRRIERASDESKWDMFASRGWEKLRSPFSLASILWYIVGLALCVIFMILVSLENVKKNVFWVVARLLQRLKSTLFEIFSNGAAPKKGVDFILWGSRATTQNTFFEIFKCETKIMKITHSVAVSKYGNCR